jgi:hypothetical protein
MGYPTSFANFTDRNGRERNIEMASNREIVTLPGHLAGMGRDVNCSVGAVKVSLPGTAEYNYVRPVIHDAPADLPDGLYQITFGGKTDRVQRHNGAWLAPIG